MVGDLTYCVGQEGGRKKEEKSVLPSLLLLIHHPAEGREHGETRGVYYACSSNNSPLLLYYKVRTYFKSYKLSCKVPVLFL